MDRSANGAMAGARLAGKCSRIAQFRRSVVLGVIEGRPYPSSEMEDIRSLSRQVDAYERTLIAQALEANEGNVAATDHLGVPRKPCTTS